MLSGKVFSAAAREPDTLLPMKACLKEVLADSGLAVMLRHPEIYTAWVDAAGPYLAPCSRIAAFRRGVLEIAVDSSSVMQEVQFRRRALLEQIQERIRKPFISDLRFIVMPTEEEETCERRED